MKNTYLVRSAAMIVSALPFVISAPIAQAQEGVSALDEIVVTARKREQSLQDTPIAITAFDSVELKAAGHEDIIDVSRATPGLFIETFNGANARISTAPRFRGVTFESTSPLQRTGSIFIDGMLVSGGIDSIGVQGLERVEIIKGPQSALFGRNTFSGAINYVTRDPGIETVGEVSLSYASRGEMRVAGAIEGGLGSDMFAGRLSASLSDKEGHYDNSVVAGQRLGDEESWSISGTLVFNPTDNARLRLRTNVYEDHDGPAASVRGAGFSDHNFGGFALPGGGTTETVFQGTVPTPFGADIGVNTSQDTFNMTTGIALADPRGVNFLDLTFADLERPGVLREGAQIALDAGFDFDNGLRLDFLAGYNENEYIAYTDFDGSPGLGFNTTGGRAIRDASIEARLSGSAMDDRLLWSFGANAVEIDVESTGGFFDGFGFWFGGIFNDYTQTGAETQGIFGTLEYQFTDQFTAILEARQQEDEISNSNVNVGLPAPISPTTFDSFLPRLLLQWEPNDDTMAYFNYSVGNLPGGFNEEIGELDAMQLAEFQALVPGVTTSFDEETLENFEVGLKKTVLDGQLAFNLAAFYMLRSDQIFSGFEVVSDPTQVNGVRTVAFTANGAETDITGFELDGAWNVSDRLSLSGSLAYVDAEISSFPAGANSGDFTAVFGPDADVKGQRAPRYPEWTGSLTAAFEMPVSAFDGSDFFTRADVFYTGDFWDENTNLARLPSATEVNLRSGLRRDNWTVEVFITNLFDEDAPTAGNNIADTGTDVRFGSPLGPYDFTRESIHVGLRDKRQVGVRVDIGF